MFPPPVPAQDWLVGEGLDSRHAIDHIIIISSPSDDPVSGSFLSGNELQQKVCTVQCVSIYKFMNSYQSLKNQELAKL